MHPSLPDATPVSVHFKYSTLYSLGFLYSVSITRSCLPEQSFSCKRNSYTRGFNFVFPVALNKVLFPKLKKKKIMRTNYGVPLGTLLRTEGCASPGAEGPVGRQP